MAGFKIEDTPKHWLTISWNVLQKKRQTSDQTYKRGNSVPLVLTYYPRLKKVILYFFMPKNKSRIYTLPPFVSFRAGFNLRKHLARAKVYTLLRECVSSGCNKSRCQTCLNVDNADIFQSFVTKESYKINHKFDCGSKCIIYLFSCKACGLQYVGSKGDSTRGYTMTIFFSPIFSKWRASWFSEWLWDHFNR